MNFSPDEEIILVCNTYPIPVEEKAVIKSVEDNCYVVWRQQGGTMPVNLDGSIPNWGNGSHMKKCIQSEN